MTRAQRRLLLSMQDAEDRGEFLSVREMTAERGSTHGTYKALLALVALGYVRRTPGRARCYAVERRIEPIVEWYRWDAGAKRLTRGDDAEYVELRQRAD